jgi:Uma2 family endonuclease
MDYMTLAEYLTTPETVLPRELAFGRLHVADAPVVPHQFAVGQLFLALSKYLEAHREGQAWLAPIDVVLDAERALVVQPDLLVVSNERAGIVRDRIYGAPDLAIEVLSPNPRVGSITTRLDWFAAYGVRECWLVYPLARRLEVIRFGDGAITSRERVDSNQPIRSSVLKAFESSLESILGTYVGWRF